MNKIYSGGLFSVRNSYTSMVIIKVDIIFNSSEVNLFKMAILKGKIQIPDGSIIYPETESSQIIDLTKAIMTQLSAVQFCSRKPSASYKVGDTANLKAGPVNIYLVCKKAGITSDTELITIPKDIKSGQSFFDGRVEWTVKELVSADNLNSNIKIDTKENWINKNPILEKGELAVETEYISSKDQTAIHIKVGDGKSSWNSLPYVTDPSIENKLDKDATAKQAEKDSEGNNIAKTYIKNITASGTTITYVKGDNSTGTCSISVPEYQIATQTQNGLMSADDKKKLDGVKNGAEPNQNAFSVVTVDSSSFSADTPTDTLYFKEGDNIALTTDTLKDQITIAVTGTVKKAESTDKATSDSRGQNIDSTYIKDVSANNNKITVTKGNGNSFIITINNIDHATSADNDSNGQKITDTYVKEIATAFDDPSTIVVTKGNGKTDTFKINSLKDIYPIGSIYLSVLETNPAVLFGFGTWQLIEAGRFLLSQGRANWGTTYTNGSTGGEATHTLSIPELPPHSHKGTAGTGGSTHRHPITLEQRHGRSGSWQDQARWSNGDVGTNGHSVTGYTDAGKGGEHTHDVTVDNTGGGAAHNNMPPYLAIYMWKRTA